MVNCQSCGETMRGSGAEWARGPRGTVEAYYCSPCYAAACSLDMIPAGWSGTDLGAAYARLLRVSAENPPLPPNVERYARLLVSIEPCIDCGGLVDTDDGACRRCCAEAGYLARIEPQ